jgi:hypothetical protein
MEDIDKNADGFIDLEEYIGKSVFLVFLLWVKMVWGLNLGPHIY